MKAYCGVKVKQVCITVFFETADSNSYIKMAPRTASGVFTFI